MAGRSGVWDMYQRRSAVHVYGLDAGVRGISTPFFGSALHSLAYLWPANKHLLHTMNR